MVWIVTAIPEPKAFRKNDWVGLKPFHVVCRSGREGSLRKDVWNAFVELERMVKDEIPRRGSKVRLMNDLKLEQPFQKLWGERPKGHSGWMFWNPYLGRVFLMNVSLGAP